MIGDPTDSNVALSSTFMGITTGSSPYTVPLTSYATAVANGWIDPVLYSYDSTNPAYVPERSQLQPYVGYWLYSYEPGYLYVPIP
jgi:hypothetical protein